MTLKRLFDNLFSAYDRTSFELGKTLQFFIDFYHFNAELTSFFIINLIYLLYIAYHWLMPLRIELELMEPRQLVLQTIADEKKKSGALNDEQHKKLSEAISSGNRSEEINGLLKDFGGSAIIDKYLTADNDVAEIQRIYDAWKQETIIQYLGIAGGLLLANGIFLTYVWYYTYLSHNNGFLFFVITVNMLIIVFIGDPYNNTHNGLLPAIELLKKSNIGIKSLKVGGRQLVEQEGPNIDMNSYLTQLADAGEVSAKMNILAKLQREIVKSVERRGDKSSVLNSLSVNIQSRTFFSLFLFGSIINYMYRIFNLINGLSPRITLGTRLSI